jgi:predicted DNA-binding transcriptional regulator AlpA
MKTKETITIDGRDYDSRRLVQQTWGINESTIARLTKKKQWPAPLKLGNRYYYERRAVETHLLSTART